MDLKELQKAREQLLKRIEKEASNLIDDILNDSKISAEVNGLEHGKQLIYNKVFTHVMNNLIRSFNDVGEVDASSLAMLPTSELLFLSRATIDVIEKVFRDKGCDL